jgi:uncharacterized protein
MFPKTDKTPDEYKKTDSKDSNFINHFFEKILRLKGIMMTSAGKSMAEAKHKLAVDFLRQFFAEEDAPEWTKYLEDFLAKADGNGSS